MEWCKQRGAISGRGSNPNRARKGGKGKRRGESGRKEASNNPLPRGLPPSLARSLLTGNTRRDEVLSSLFSLCLCLCLCLRLCLSVRSVILLLLLPLQINDQTKKAARPNNKLVLGLLVGSHCLFSSSNSSISLSTVIIIRSPSPATESDIIQTKKQGNYNGMNSSSMTL